MRDTKSTLLNRWFEEVWNQNLEDSIDKLMTTESMLMEYYQMINPKEHQDSRFFTGALRSNSTIFESLLRTSFHKMIWNAP